MIERRRVVRGASGQESPSSAAFSETPSPDGESVDVTPPPPSGTGEAKAALILKLGAMRELRTQQRRQQRRHVASQRSVQEETLALLKGQIKRYLAGHPKGPQTPLERVALASLKHELTQLLEDIKRERDAIGRQMGQTSMRSKAVSAYAKAFKKT